MTTWMAKCKRRIERQFRHNVLLYLSREKIPELDTEKNSSVVTLSLKREPRSAFLAAEVAVYWVLWTRLREEENVRTASSASSLCSSMLHRT